MTIVMYFIFSSCIVSPQTRIMAELAAIDMYIISKIRERRMELGYTQEHLSFLLGKAEGYMSNFESHKRGKHFSTRMLNELAKALECSPRSFWPEKPL